MDGETKSAKAPLGSALGPAVLSGILFALGAVLLRVLVHDEALADALPISVFSGAVFALTFGGITALIQRGDQSEASARNGAGPPDEADGGETQDGRKTNSF